MDHESNLLRGCARGYVRQFAGPQYQAEFNELSRLLPENANADVTGDEASFDPDLARRRLRARRLLTLSGNFGRRAREVEWGLIRSHSTGARPNSFRQKNLAMLVLQGTQTRRDESVSLSLQASAKRLRSYIGKPEIRQDDQT
jgi:hypothetical protein